MKVRVTTALFVALFAAGPVLAQQTAGPQLNPQQTEGRNSYARSCSICHLPPQFGAGTYGPRLITSTVMTPRSVATPDLIYRAAAPKCASFLWMNRAASWKC